MGVSLGRLRALFNSRPGMVFTLVVAIVGTTTLGVAGAASTGLISACVNKSSGTVRIITPGAASSRDRDDERGDERSLNGCTRNEMLLTWNSEGVPGPQGPTGATGPQGVAGATGATGLTGATGPQGLSGPAGPTGAQGLAGASGPAGASGSQGPTGPEGATGPQGATGPTGAGVTTTTELPGGPNCPFGGVRLDSAFGASFVCNGASGVDGQAGATGPAGPSGPTGAVGPKGDTGATGPQGPAGTGGAGGLTFYKRFGNTSVPNTGTHVGTVLVYCDAGDMAMGGGYSAGSMTVEYDTLDSSIPGTEGWFVTARNNTGSPLPLFVVVICANTAP